MRSETFTREQLEMKKREIKESSDLTSPPLWLQLSHKWNLERTAWLIVLCEAGTSIEKLCNTFCMVGTSMQRRLSCLGLKTCSDQSKTELPSRIPKTPKDVARASAQEEGADTPSPEGPLSPADESEGSASLSFKEPDNDPASCTLDRPYLFAYCPTSRVIAPVPPVDRCQWPHGEVRDKDFHYCGKRIHSDFPYCKEHASRAYTEPKPRKHREPDMKTHLISNV